MTELFSSASNRSAEVTGCHQVEILLDHRLDQPLQRLGRERGGVGSHHDAGSRASRLLARNTVRYASLRLSPGPGSDRPG